MNFFPQCYTCGIWYTHAHTCTHIYARRIAFELQSKVLRRVTSHRGWASEISGICQLQRERREEWKTGGGVLARAGNPPATHLNCKWPERFSVPSVRPDEAFPRNAAGTCQLFFHLRVFACMRASLRVYAPSSLSLPLIRRSLPSPEAAEKFS